MINEWSVERVTHTRGTDDSSETPSLEFHIQAYILGRKIRWKTRETHQATIIDLTAPPV